MQNSNMMSTNGMQQMLMGSIGNNGGGLKPPGND